MAADRGAQTLRDSRIEHWGYVRQAIPDERGAILPKATRKGTAGWTGSEGHAFGRLMLSNSQTAMVRTFNCYGIYYICGVGLAPGNNYASAGGIDETDASISVCVILSSYNPPSNCTIGQGNPGFAYVSPGYNWYSGNNSISILGSGQGTQYAQWNLLAAGTTTSNLQLTMSSPYEYCQASGGQIVQAPTSLQGPQTPNPYHYWNNQALQDCNGTPVPGGNPFYGVSLCSAYKVLDQNGAQISQAGLAFDEVLEVKDTNANVTSSSASVWSGPQN